MHRTIALVGLALGFAAVVLQLIVTLTTAETSLVVFVTSLAVIANILAGLVYAGVLFDTQAFAAFRNRGVQGLAATAMVFAMMFFHLVAGEAAAGEGTALIADWALNYIAPTLFVAYWMVYLTDGTLRLRNAAVWLVFPALYIGWVLLIGSTTGIYASEVLDVAADGWSAVAINYLTFMAAFLMLSVFAVGFDTEKKPVSGHVAQH